jgi:hypothetical protein
MAITVDSDVEGLLGITISVPNVLLTLADRWVVSRMEAKSLSIPTVATDGMKLAGAFICAALYIDSKESNKAWNQQVVLGGSAGSTFVKSDAAKIWEQRAIDQIDALASSSGELFEAVTYWDDDA